MSDTQLVRWAILGTGSIASDMVQILKTHLILLDIIEIHLL